MNPNRTRFLDESGSMNTSWGLSSANHSGMVGGGGGGGGGGTFGHSGSYYGGGGGGGGAGISGVNHGHGHSFGNMNYSMNQSQVEPMHHSPISSGGMGGGGGDRIAYLPAYLLGEPGAKSSKTKLRKDGTPNLDLSGLSQGGGGGMSMSGASSPTSHHNPHQHPGGSPGKTSPGLHPSTTPHSLFSSMSALHGQNPNQAKNTLSTTPTTTKTKSTGPPKHGLGSGSSSSSSTGVGGAPPKSARVEFSSEGQPGQGNWVTVFGFQPASQPFVLQTFSQVGSIIEYKAVPGCNFMHIRYSNTVEARKALFKNGGIIGGNMMIGVIKYEPTNSPAVISGSSADSNPSLQSRIRPLANDNLANQIPVRETGLMSKVTELLGW